MYLKKATETLWTEYTGINEQNSHATINDNNGKKCGIIRECLNEAVA